MEKYRIIGSLTIKKYEIVKETNSRITYKVQQFSDGKIYERTENKISSSVSWHDTLEDAKRYLINKNNEIISEREKDIAFAKSTIQKIKALKEI